MLAPLEEEGGGRTRPLTSTTPVDAPRQGTVDPLPLLLPCALARSRVETHHTLPESDHAPQRQHETRVNTLRHACPPRRVNGIAFHQLATRRPWGRRARCTNTEHQS